MRCRSVLWDRVVAKLEGAAPRGAREAAFLECVRVSETEFGNQLSVIEIIGGPDRDRTDDLFHAIIGSPLKL